MVLSLQASELVIHVSPEGDDALDGLAAVPSGKSGPVRQLSVALKRMQALRRGEPRPSGLRIQLQSGWHYIAERIVITPQDSGLSEAVPLIIRGPAGGKAVLSGGVRLTNWTRVDGKDLWGATVPMWVGDATGPRSLFVNGTRATLARTPNQGFLRQDGEALSTEPFSFKFHNDEVKPEWAAAGAEVVAFHKWIDLRHPIRSVNSESRTVTLAGNIATHVKEANARYLLENFPQALDAPGEWLYEASARQVLYMAAEGEDPNRLEIVMPVLEGGIMKFEGDHRAGIPVQHVQLEGITFAHTDWTLPAAGYYDTQAAVRIHGEVWAEGAVNCVVTNCTFTGLSGYGIELGLGCRNWRIERNEFVDCGAGGVRLGEPSRITPTPYQANSGHMVTDNLIHKMGRMFPAAAGVFILQSGDNLIAHNHIHDLYYTGISVGWNWGYRETPCRNNRIEFNHIHNIGQAMLSDMGGIYTLGIQRGTMLRNNVIHDVTSFGYGGWGIYPDEGTTGVLIESNVVYRTKSAGFHQHYGRENLVRNNIFAFGTEHQIMRSREEEHVSFMLDRNVVIFDSGTLLGSNWKNEKFTSDYNLFWDLRGAEGMKFAGALLGEWQKRGHDRHSVVADPLFENVEDFRKGGEFGVNAFRLRTNSPAFGLGFRQINVSQVGRRGGGRPQISQIGAD